MKVLHLGAGNLYGGVETFLVTLARQRQLAPDMHPEFALCFRGRVWDELSAAGVPVHDLGAVRLSRPWTVLRARRALRKLLAARRPDVAVVHSGWVHLIFGPLLKAAGVRLAFFAHGPLDRPTWLDRWAARTRPGVVIANSRFTAVGAPATFPGVPTEVVYLPVQLDLPADREGTRAEVRREFDTPDGATVILTACRMEEWKGHPVLLEALGRLRAEPNWLAWIAGGVQRPQELEYLAELKTTAERLGIVDRVRFVGQRADIPRLLVAADLLCQPNTGPEPFGLAFVEALAAGLPVVTTAIGGAVEIVDESCGVLVPPNDPTAVAEALRTLVADSARRRALGGFGPSRAAKLCEPLGRLRSLQLRLAGPGHDPVQEAPE